VLTRRCALSGVSVHECALGALVVAYHLPTSSEAVAYGLAGQRALLVKKDQIAVFAYDGENLAVGQYGNCSGGGE
jgi:hypothetical protein